MASLSPRTAPIPFVHAPQYSTTVPAHTLAASPASQKFRPKSATRACPRCGASSATSPACFVGEFAWEFDRLAWYQLLRYATLSTKHLQSQAPVIRDPEGAAVVGGAGAGRNCGPRGEACVAVRSPGSPKFPVLS